MRLLINSRLSGVELLAKLILPVLQPGLVFQLKSKLVLLSLFLKLLLELLLNPGHRLSHLNLTRFRLLCLFRLLLSSLLFAF